MFGGTLNLALSIYLPNLFYSQRVISMKGPLLLPSGKLLKVIIITIIIIIIHVEIKVTLSQKCCKGTVPQGQ